MKCTKMQLLMLFCVAVNINTFSVTQNKWWLIVGCFCLATVAIKEFFGSKRDG